MRSLKSAWPAPIFAGAGAWALTGGVPRDSLRVVITRPDTIGAHVGSLSTWLSFIIAQKPLHAGALGACVLGLALTAWVVADVHLAEAAWSDPTVAVTDGSGNESGEKTETDS